MHSESGKGRLGRAAHPASALQQEEGVKALKDLDGGLVDGHHHSAPIARHILH